MYTVCVSVGLITNLIAICLGFPGQGESDGSAPEAKVAKMPEEE